MRCVLGCDKMIKIFDEKCIHIMQTKDGFVAVLQTEDEDGRPHFRFKHISVKEDTARDIDKDYFKILKFGRHYDNLKMQMDNYLLTICKPLEKDICFTVAPNGIVKILDKQGCLINQGDFNYQSCIPFDVAIGDNVVWASYPELNTAVRYNLSTLRQELRIGGAESKVLHAPNGLLLQDQQLYICNASENQILLLDTVNFTVQEHFSFNEPVYQYIKIEGFNIVRLKSGVYSI